MIQRILCGFLGWHRPEVGGWCDGASVHTRCRRCGYVGMLDSQGNLF